ncbi:hypothetical protein HPB47_006591 [Ixodes persulcatus]|uniref:Uncharacterized protein n=1 Tax=Ixodes persulcatus TaxID=34615 RepID=A0AC60P9X0_IXOPE|nr:hypothetical protein HPB47_006591 [Ixodes persulcatus]
MKAPKFKLKSLPTALLENPLPKKTFFTKIDLAEAYYHFSLSPANPALSSCNSSPPR